MRVAFSTLCEAIGLTAITAGCWQAFGVAGGLLAGGVALVVVGVTQA